MRATIFASVLLLGVTACTDKPEPPKRTQLEPSEPEAAANPHQLPSGVRFEIANATGSCARTLCIAGPGPLSEPANGDLGELCRRSPGVVRRCEGERCASVWAIEQWPEGLEALLISLDDNADGRVDNHDTPCRINVAGWSLGGMIAAEQVPAALLANTTISPERSVVDHLVTVVPWSPGHAAQIDIGENVRKAWIYRHTRTPAEDCSTAYEGGPWLSPAPVCRPGTQCWDYDYSLEPMLGFLGRRGARSGLEVDHCQIMSLVAKIGLDNLKRGIEARAELVPRLSNGEPGGRVHTGPDAPDPLGHPDSPRRPR